MSTAEQSNEETHHETDDHAEESAEQSAEAKLRDLKPEKDPIGAGHATAPDASTTR